MTPLVSIIIPTIGRPEKLQRLLTSIKEKAGIDDYEVIVLEDSPPPDNVGVPKMVKKMVDGSSGALVMYLGNDCVMEDNCLKNAVDCMKEHFPDMDGLIGLNDSHFKGELATHWLASKKLLPMLDGEFFHTGYYHTYCDNELTARCRKADKYHWCEQARIIHDHPYVTGDMSQMDDIYQSVYQREKIQHDLELLMERALLLNF